MWPYELVMAIRHACAFPLLADCHLALLDVRSVVTFAAGGDSVASPFAAGDPQSRAWLFDHNLVGVPEPGFRFL